MLAFLFKYASVAELVDAHDSKSCGSNSMRVRFSPEAQVNRTKEVWFFCPFKGKRLRAM